MKNFEDQLAITLFDWLEEGVDETKYQQLMSLYQTTTYPSTLYLAFADVLDHSMMVNGKYYSFHKAMELLKVNPNK